MARMQLSNDTGTSVTSSDGDRRSPDGSPPLLALVGAGLGVHCLDGTERPYVDLDCAASTPASAAVAAQIGDFLPRYSSVHRGAGFKSRTSTAAYEAARLLMLRHVGREGSGDTAIICRNTTEALNHLAFRLRLDPDDVVLTTVVEHHANLLPWARYAHRRHVECGTDGVFDLSDVVAALDMAPVPKVLAITGASNVTGWLPPIAEICAAAHARGVPVVLDAAQLAPHRPVPRGADGTAGPDFIAWSGHKMYAPFGAGALVGPATAFADGEPFLAGGGAVELVDLDEVLWTDPPEREEAGSPNVVGAVALGAAIEELARLGWDAIERHETVLATRLRGGLGAMDGVHLLGPSSDTETLAVATFTVEGMHHGLVAARLAAEFGIGVRHGCFCAHPYLTRLLGLGAEHLETARSQVRRGDHRHIPGAVRASAGLGTTLDDVERFLDALRAVLSGAPPPVEYFQDSATGDFFPATDDAAWWAPTRNASGGCARG
ncbi:MAG: aminotransferase class V-fold PLP-dependent enzyme [Actinomycetota bacterium]|nr:aminotransferase class V-fold PLP-dependent enzyme [Actinomycetota bacterium]